MTLFKTILFATDFSTASRMAFKSVAELARASKARIVAVHVIAPARLGFNKFASYIGPEEDRELAMEQLQSIWPPSPMISIEYRLLEGEPATVIVETAEETEADLIVMGTHGREGLARLVMGSVAEEVLRRAPCPVLALREAVAEKVAATAQTPAIVPDLRFGTTT